MSYQRSKARSLIPNLDFSKIVSDRKIMLIVALCLLVFVSAVVAIGYFYNRHEYIAIPPTAEYVPDELLVSYKDGKAPHQINESEKLKLDEKLKTLGVVSQEKAYPDITEGDLSRSYLLKLESGLDIVTLQGQLSDINGIVSSQPNFIYQLFATPNDPQYGSLWGMPAINAPTAWDTSTGSNSVVVGVLDTGLDMNHPDLAGVGVSPYSAMTGGSGVTDYVGHGTHVAGTIGAVGNNGIGVAGVNWNVSIMPIQVCSSGGCPQVAIINGIYKAADSGVRVINMSLGTSAPGVDTCPPTQDTYKAIQYAISKGVTVVVAAGNDARDASQVAPASCPGVITVGASTPGDGKAGFSNFGSTVEISAPGVEIVSTIPGGGYKSLQGTSMASPHVAGAAALLLSVNPSLSPQQVSDCLVSNADPTSASSLIGPRLNIANAIANCAGVAGPIPTATPNPLVSPTPPTTARFYISGRVFQDNNGDGTYNSGDLGLGGETLTLSGNFSDTTTTLTDGTYIFDNLFEGIFNVAFQTSSRDGINLTQTSPAAILNFIVTKDLANPTPTVVAGQPIAPITPTPTQVPPVGGGATRAPTPTPPTLYVCEFDPKCGQGHSNIQLCPLVCRQK